MVRYYVLLLVVGLLGCQKSNQIVLFDSSNQDPLLIVAMQDHATGPANEMASLLSKSIEDRVFILDSIPQNRPFILLNIENQEPFDPLKSGEIEIWAGKRKPTNQRQR